MQGTFIVKTTIKYDFVYTFFVINKAFEKFQSLIVEIFFAGDGENLPR